MRRGEGGRGREMLTPPQSDSNCSVSTAATAATAAFGSLLVGPGSAGQCFSHSRHHSGSSSSIKTNKYVSYFTAFLHSVFELSCVNMGWTGVADLDITACLGLMFSIFPVILSPTTAI